MSHFIVSADTYRHAYGIEITVFGIFPSQEEAVKWIMEHPVVSWGSGELGESQETFSFFEDYDECRIVPIYEKTEQGRFVLREKRHQSKEEWVLQNFIKEFSGSPIYLGGYIE